ncbi:MAG: diguanylate cyclase [Vallitaleaceae bacterium]|nr:diguanylate cyclase [Vallitaleaceae bacterium]
MILILDTWTFFIESILFLTGNFMQVSRLSSIGIAIFLLLLVLDTLKHLNIVIEKDVDQLITSREKLSFRLTTFDLTNLKNINDTYGHASGDQVLKAFYNNLVTAFGSDSNCYRVGGHESDVYQKNPRRVYNLYK